MVKYTISEIPPSNNKYIGRDVRWAYRDVKKQWETLVAYTCVPRPKRPLQDVTVKLTYYFPDKRRRDPDNYSGKMILDGLTKAGILADDSFGCIDLILRGRYDKTHPRTEIEIKENE